MHGHPNSSHVYCQSVERGRKSGWGFLGTSSPPPTLSPPHYTPSALLPSPLASSSSLLNHHHHVILLSVSGQGSLFHYLWATASLRHDNRWISTLKQVSVCIKMPQICFNWLWFPNRSRETFCGRCPLEYVSHWLAFCLQKYTASIIYPKYRQMTKLV